MLLMSCHMHVHPATTWDCGNDEGLSCHPAKIPFDNGPYFVNAGNAIYQLDGMSSPICMPRMHFNVNAIVRWLPRYISKNESPYVIMRHVNAASQLDAWQSWKDLPPHRRVFYQRPRQIPGWHHSPAGKVSAKYTLKPAYAPWLMFLCRN